LFHKKKIDAKSSLLNLLKAEILKKQLEENEKQMKAMQQSYEEKLAASQAVVSDFSYLIFLISFIYQSTSSKTGNLESSKMAEKAKKTPHLSNINMDPALNGTIKLLIEGEGPKKIGTSDKCDIKIKGLG
jgi:hypothetical protein